MLTLVAITQRVIEDARGERRDALDQRWTGFLAAAGICPLIVPNDVGAALELMRTIDPAGVVLTGGGDLAAYGGNAPERDATEAALVDWAAKRSRPVLGVCRGMQFLLHRGGVALQRAHGHVRTRHHLVLQDSLIAVNSYHDWAASSVDSEVWDVLARAADGAVEAVRHHAQNWLGIMWHPEREAEPAAHDVRLFREHFAAPADGARCAA